MGGNGSSHRTRRIRDLPRSRAVVEALSFCAFQAVILFCGGQTRAINGGSTA
jgi:hypothetical protein